MEEKLTREEVLHVANLARIEIDEDEIAMYQVKLKQLLNEIEKIDKEINTLVYSLYGLTEEEIKTIEGVAN